MGSRMRESHEQDGEKLAPRTLAQRHELPAILPWPS
jgi:hypothetical protein